MARSNTNYYNLCDKGEGFNFIYAFRGVPEGECPWHGGRFRRGGKCYGENEYATRRGIYRRKRRFPKWGIKASHPPPMCIKKIWRRQARARQQQELRLHQDDPIITPMKRLVNLWDWY